MRIVKILCERDIEKDVDEKRAARILEKSTEGIRNSVCVFTVVPNAFVGLEYSETTCFDIIFVQKDLESLNGYQMLQVLRNVGAPMPIILVTKHDDPTTDEQAKSAGFYCVLQKEYQIVELRRIITSILKNRGRFQDDIVENLELIQNEVFRSEPNTLISNII
jgi:CheY-like chemotaxis protein